MDTLAHGLYGAAIFAHTKNEKLMALGGILGMLPDLIVYGVYAAKGYIPPNVPESSLSLYHVTHSLVLVGAVAALLFIFKRKWAVFILPYALHILFDIPTHCGLFSTWFLYPVSDINFCNFNYGESLWAWEINYGIIVFIYYLIYRRWYKNLSPA